MSTFTRSISTFTSGNSESINDQVQNISIKQEVDSDDASSVTDYTSIPYETMKYEGFFPSSTMYASDSCNSNKETGSSSDSDDDYVRENKKNYKKLQKIQSHISLLQELLYKERIREVDDKLVQAKSGLAEFQIPVQKLQDQLKSRLEKATVLKQLKIECLMREYDAKNQAIRQNYENEKEILYNKIKADLEKKIEDLDRERINAKIDAALLLNHECGRGYRCRCERGCERGRGRGRGQIRGRGRGRGRGLRRGQHSFRPLPHLRKPVPVISGPYIVHMLREEEILEDWTAIQKLMPPKPCSQ